MTPRQAALHYAASLLDQALAACHQEVMEDKIGWPTRIVFDTFEKAPSNVQRALEKLDGEAVAEEMAKLAEELRRMVKTEAFKHEEWCDLMCYNECSCGAAEEGDQR